MKAVRLHQRGGPEQLVYEDAPKPEPAANEIRIRVRAAALTPGELTWDQTYQHADGSSRLPSIPVHDVAGMVDLLGPNVKEMKVGEPVFALIDFPRDGSAAEYVVAPVAEVAAMPKSLDFINAAAVPLSALTAWQALFDHGKLAAGQRVLIHGGSGGVGAFAVQMAKSIGAKVIATASARNKKLVEDLGADQFIDYSAEPFDRVLRDIDVVFDTIGGETLARSYSVLRRGGRLVSINAMPDQSRAAPAGITALFFIVRPSRPQLEKIADLIDAGKLRTNIEQVFPLANAREAFERVQSGHLHGKVILQVA